MRFFSNLVLFQLCVLGHLNHRHLFACTSVCRELNVLGNDQSLWAALFRRYFKSDVSPRSTVISLLYRSFFLEKKETRRRSWTGRRYLRRHRISGTCISSCLLGIQIMFGKETKLHGPPPRVWPSHGTSVGSPYSTERYSTERYSFMRMRGGEYDRLPYSLASPLRPIHPYSRGGGRVGSLFPPT